MKKALILLVISAMLLSLCACSHVELPPLPSASTPVPDQANT